MEDKEYKLVMNNPFTIFHKGYTMLNDNNTKEKFC